MHGSSEGIHLIVLLCRKFELKTICCWNYFNFLHVCSMQHFISLLVEM
jgi:hypothetical protein